MKKFLSIMISFCLLLSLCGCKGGCYESGGEGLDIVTTVFPAFDFAREIVKTQNQESSGFSKC